MIQGIIFLLLVIYMIDKPKRKKPNVGGNQKVIRRLAHKREEISAVPSSSTLPQRPGKPLNEGH